MVPKLSVTSKEDKEERANASDAPSPRGDPHPIRRVLSENVPKPQQRVRSKEKFNVVVAGGAGLGKGTFLESFFEQAFDPDHPNVLESEARERVPIFTIEY